jgi:hypothetical protein
MGSGAMIYIPSFIKFGSALQKLIVAIHKHGNRIILSLPPPPNKRSSQRNCCSEERVEVLCSIAPARC